MRLFGPLVDNTCPHLGHFIQILSRKQTMNVGLVLNTSVLRSIFDIIERTERRKYFRLFVMAFVRIKEGYSNIFE